MQTFSYVNGELFESEKAVVSVFDHGFTVADGVFETLKFSSGVPFAVDRHLRRLAKSAKGLGIAVPSQELISKALAEVSAANQSVKQGRMRITVTSGAGPLGSDRLAANPTLVISVAEQKTWPNTAKIAIVPWIRNEKSPLVGLKSISYAENVIALEKAHSFGFDEAIFLSSTGLLSEGTGSNIFLVKNGEVLTPGINSGLLEGITRELLIEWASETHVLVEKDLSLEDLIDADEIFITSSTRDIQPVSKLGQISLDGAISLDQEYSVGPITSGLIELFAQKSSELVNP